MVSEKYSTLLDSQNVHDYEATPKILLKQKECHSQHRFSQGQKLNGAAWGWSPRTQIRRTQSAFCAWLHLRLHHTARELSWGTRAISGFKSLIQIVSISLARTEGHLHFASRCMLYKKTPQNLPCTTDRRAWRAPDSYESTGSQGVGYTAERCGTQYTWCWVF